VIKLHGVLLASTAGDVLTGLLPFVLLIGFWMFLIRRMRGNTPRIRRSRSLRRSARSSNVCVARSKAALKVSW